MFDDLPVGKEALGLLRVGELERAEEEAPCVEFDGCRTRMRGKQFSSGVAACVKCFYGHGGGWSMRPGSGSNLMVRSISFVESFP
jgi:hypothetical protein